jgi:hypothetical protein
MTPNSSKSTQQKMKEGLTDTGDKLARYDQLSILAYSNKVTDRHDSGIQPDESKSNSQKMSDKFGRSKDEHVHGGPHESIMDKTKHVLGMDKH